MAEEMDESVLKADRWSRFLALFGALTAYIGVSWLVGDAAFALLVAALIGIGLRIYAQYHVSRANSKNRGSSLGDHPMTGEYHYGAVGAALVIGPLFAVIIAMLEPNLAIVISTGTGTTVLTFAVLRVALPK